MDDKDTLQPNTGIKFKLTPIPEAGMKPQLVFSCIGRKLPRTPAEYAELTRNSCATESSQSVKNSIAPYKSCSNPECVKQQNTLSTECSYGAYSATSFDDKNNVYEKLNPETMVSYKGYDVKQQKILSPECSSGACRATGFGDKNSIYENLNPEMTGI